MFPSRTEVNSAWSWKPTWKLEGKWKELQTPLLSSAGEHALNSTRVEVPQGNSPTDSIKL